MAIIKSKKQFFLRSLRFSLALGLLSALSFSALAADCSDEYLKGKLEHYRKLALQIKKDTASESGLPALGPWANQFPMAVFGTLREFQSNHGYMKSSSGDYTYECSRKALLPSFYAEGIHLKQNTHSTTPFEVYFYDEANWKKALPGIDHLESFTPETFKDLNYSRGYARTLAWLYLYPKGYKGAMWFGPDVNLFDGKKRDSNIPEAVYQSMIKIPAWIYLNPENAIKSLERNPRKSPLIWPTLWPFEE